MNELLIFGYTVNYFNGYIKVNDIDYRKQMIFIILIHYNIKKSR